MASVIGLPKLGLTMTKGRITRWLKNEGDSIKKGEPLVEFETDKINTEYESAVDGYILKILAQPGEEVAVSAPICIIGEKDEAVEEMPDKGRDTRKTESMEKAAAASGKNGLKSGLDEAPGRILISPYARKLAKEYSIDIRGIKGSKPNGRIVARDILEAVRKRAAAEKETAGLSGMRRKIAEKLSYSKREIPHAYFRMQVDMGPAKGFREQYAVDLKEMKGVELKFTHLIIKAVAEALKQHPEINSSFTGDAIAVHKDINIGIAVDIKGGLMVPVLKNAGTKPFPCICREADELVNKARAGKLEHDDIAGCTFTISNLGMFGVDEFTAVINPPEAAILAVGAIKDCAVAESGEIKIKPMMNLVLSVDHRVIDGAPAARFLGTVKKLLENPGLLMAV